mmetsp:Transcript_6613/g.18313  ORF Transcript_6613/g.18313 Transcript_6613/m.18313 type:complete len:203 (+) Transcript_6613:748-1356(+)
MCVTDESFGLGNAPQGGRCGGNRPGARHHRGALHGAGGRTNLDGNELGGGLDRNLSSRRGRLRHRHIQGRGHDRRGRRRLGRDGRDWRGWGGRRRGRRHYGRWRSRRRSRWRSRWRSGRWGYGRRHGRWGRGRGGLAGRIRRDSFPWGTRAVRSDERRVNRLGRHVSERRLDLAPLHAHVFPCTLRAPILVPLLPLIVGVRT